MRRTIGLSLVLILLLITLWGGAAAASPSAGQTPPTTARPPGCRTTTQPDVVYVTRSGSVSPDPLLENTTPFHRTVRNVVAARQLFASLCSLPTLFPGAGECPVDYGIRLVLDIRYGSRRLLHAKVDAGGCGEVTFDHPATGLPFVATGRFWSLLASALGLPERKLRPYRLAMAEVDTVTHGLKLSLLLPLVEPFPHAALLHVLVRVTNLSRQDAVSLPRDCESLNPTAQVVTGSGAVTSQPPTYQPLPLISCPALPPLLVAPGRTISQWGYVVLRDRFIRAAVTLDERGSLVQVTGRAYRLTTYNGTRRPIVRLVFGPRHQLIGIDVIPRQPPGGPLLSVGSAECRDSGETGLDWLAFPGPWNRPQGTLALGRRLLPGCRDPVRWQVWFGWVGQSVGSVNYVRTKSTMQPRHTMVRDP